MEYQRGDELISTLNAPVRNNALLLEDVKKVLRFLDGTGIRRILSAFNKPCNARCCLLGFV